MVAWTDAEYCVGIITGSLPPCRAIFLKVFAPRKSASGPDHNSNRSEFLLLGNGRSWSNFWSRLKPAERSIQLLNQAYLQDRSSTHHFYGMKASIDTEKSNNKVFCTTAIEPSEANEVWPEREA